MRKLILALIALLAIGIVSAGSIGDAQYYDRDTNLWWDNNQIRTLNDNDVDIDADTLGGSSYGDIIDYSNTNDRRVIAVIDSNSAAWNTDRVGGGISQDFLSLVLYNDREQLNTQSESFQEETLRMCYENNEDLRQQVGRLERQMEALAKYLGVNFKY